ncbi:hypothetical protein ACTZWT_16810 [Rhodopseudomonas sp. NSM]|uniref:hypothetical protein n=1 Tax=Rhodopseudomonas sp. NSM TaxID=3457630 RepID=UPI00403717A3
MLQIKFGRTIHHGTGFVNSALDAAVNQGAQMMPANPILDVEGRPTRIGAA